MKLEAKKFAQYSKDGKTSLPAGRHSIGDNLYLQVTSSTAASWIFMGKIGDKRREIGLGSFLGTGRIRRLTITEAKLEAAKIRVQLQAGQDPLASRSKRVKAATFAEMLEGYLEKESASWKGGMKGAGVKQWRQAFAKHCPALLKTPVARITTETVLYAIKPVWSQSLGDTMRDRIASVLEYARVRGKRHGKNPAAWEDHLEHLLPAKTVKGAKNFAALTFDQVPAFKRELAALTTMQAKVLTFIIMTAVRANEAAGAPWSEFDLEAGLWTISKERMKTNVAHIVPLSTQAIALLRSLPRTGDYVFPAAQDPTKPMDTRLMNELIERMGYKGRTTVHGFRSSFRVWGDEQTRGDGTKMYADQDLEFCLAHKISDKVVAAYLRSSAIGRRAVIMQAWADFVDCVSKVVQLPVREVA